MDYRSLGRSGLKVSPLCLGTMMFGGATDDATADRCLRRHDLGTPIGSIDDRMVLIGKVACAVHEEPRSVNLGRCRV